MTNSAGRQLNNLLSYEDARVFSRLPVATKKAFVATLTDAEAAQLKYLWEAWARDNQLPPLGRWTVWLNMGGRGSGKTRAGAEWMRKKKETTPFLHLIGRTAADVRDVMIEGESGIMAISPPWDKPEYQRSKRRLVWKNGAQAITFSADEPESLRGPQCGGMWCDEPGAWRFAMEAWDNASLGCRLGDEPQACLTTTPRVTKLIKRLVASPSTKISRSTVYENRANLAGEFFSEIIRRYEGTRFARQELEGLLIEDNEDALWHRDAMIEAFRVTRAPDLVRIVVGVDPATTSAEGSAETGIVVAGMARDGYAYVLDDRSVHGSPKEWAEGAVAAYYTFFCDRIVGEVNNGGDLVERNIRTVDGGENVSYKKVTASRGKYIRAEPIASLYEQGRVHHVGTFPELEDQMCQWVPGTKSPDRLDALVWALTELDLNGGDAPYAIASTSPVQHLPPSYEPGENEVEKDERERLVRRQTSLSRFLQDIGGLRR